MAYCVNCGRRLQATDRFCAHCGQFVAQPPPPQWQEAAPAKPEQPFTRRPWVRAMGFIALVLIVAGTSFAGVSLGMRAYMQALSSAYTAMLEGAGEADTEEGMDEESAEEESTGESAEADVGEEDSSAATHANPAETGSANFERGNWGMTSDEILKLEKDRVIGGDAEDVEDGELDIRVDDIYDYEVRGTYVFEDNELISGEYRMVRRFKEQTTEAENFARMREYMIARYGEDFKECEVWYVGLGLETPSKFEESFENGELERYMYWEQEDRLVVFLYSKAEPDYGESFTTAAVLISPNDEGNREYYGSHFEYYTELTAVQLAQAFSKEERAAATRRYVGRELYVIGTLKEIDAEANTVLVEGDADHGDVRFKFADPGVAAQLTVGDTVGIIGICEGHRSGEVFMGESSMYASEHPVAEEGLLKA